MKLKDVKNIRLGGQNVLSIKYDGQYIWKKSSAKSTPLTIVGEIFLTSSASRLFGLDSSYGTLSRIDKVYIDDKEVVIKDTYVRGDVGATTNTKHTLKIVMKEQEEYNLSRLFYNHGGLIFTGAAGTTSYKGLEILPNENGQKYKVSSISYFMQAANSTTNASFAEIKGLNNLDISGVTSFAYCFRYIKARKIDISSWYLDVSIDSMFVGNTASHLEELYLDGTSRTMQTCFASLGKLRTVSFGGKIVGNTSFADSPLDKDSIYNIVNAMTVGNTATLTISQQTRAYFNDNEWNELLSIVPRNWSIAVADTSVAAASLMIDED